MTREEILTELKALKAGQWTDKSADAIAAVLDHYLDNEIGIPGIELDEAEQKYVETCECPPANQEEERMVYEAYKAGWAVRDAQLSKLLGDMDEAAKSYAGEQEFWWIRENLIRVKNMLSKPGPSGWRGGV